MKKHALGVLGMGYIYVLYIILACCVVVLFGKLFGEFNGSDKPTVYLIIEVFMMMWLYGIIYFSIRNYVIPIIPFPFDDIGSYHTLTNELIDCFIFGYVFFTCTFSIRNRLILIYNRVMGTNYDLYQSKTP